MSGLSDLVTRGFGYYSWHRRGTLALVGIRVVTRVVLFCLLRMMVRVGAGYQVSARTRNRILMPY